MKDALVLAVPCLVLAVLYCAWRVADLLRRCVPATATVMRSDYTDLEREEDLWSLGTLGTRRGWNWRDGENARLIEDEVTFADRGGRQHRVVVERRVHRGWRPSGVYTVWYDREDPSRVTAFGPGHWLMFVAMYGCLLVMVFYAGINGPAD